MEIEAVSILHWTLVMSAVLRESPEKRLLQPIDAFVRTVGMDQVDVDNLMALAKSKVLLKQYTEAQNVLNQIIAMHSWYVPALTEKALLLASLGEWEQSLDTTQRVLDINKDNLDALRILTVYAFTQEAIPDDAVQKLEDYDSVLNSLESTSSVLFAQAGSLFARICSRHPRVLQMCERQLDRASRLAPTDAHILCELGYIMNMQGQYKTASRHYHEASRVDGSSIEAIEGMMLSQILDGELADAESQVDLINVMLNSPEEASAEYLFLQALVARKGGTKSMSEHLDKLIECRRVFLSQNSDLSITIAKEPLLEYVTLNPDFTLVLAAEFLMHMETPVPLIFAPSATDSSKPRFLSSGRSPSTISNKSDSFLGGNKGGVVKVGTSPDVPQAVLLAIELLQGLLKRFPGQVSVYVELSRCLAAQEKFDDACKSLRQCLALQPDCSAALIALAKTECARFNTSAANHAMEQALSSNLKIRTSPQFKLVQAMVRAQQGRSDEAMIEVEALMQTDDFKVSVHDGLETFTRISMQAEALRLTLDDRVSVFIARASLLNGAKRVKDANKTLSEAKILFSGTPQEVQILVASSQLAVERGDYDSAVRVLDKISEDSPTFTKAQLIKAEILLTNNRDKEGFTKCYLDLLDRDKTSAAYCMLGEAYLRILNPELAVDAFVQAYGLDPSNSQLRERIGKSLVATHEYHRAVNFYESALNEANRQSSGGGRSKSSELVNLSHDLARLHMKLGHYESASRVLLQTLHETQRDIYEKRNDIVTLRLMLEVQHASMPGEVADTLRRAKELQKEVMNDVRLSLNTAGAASSELMDREKALLSALCVELGEYLAAENSLKAAEDQFTEAVSVYAQNLDAMMGLARIHRSRRNLEQCASQCKRIISFDPAHEGACILLSDMLIQLRADGNKGAFEEDVSRPLKDLLQVHPNNYPALASLISLLRKQGELSLVKGFIEAAEKANRRAGSHAGLRFCKGLYARYTNDVGKAIHEFNFARKDSVWGERALVHMVELYLNPDQEGAWEDCNEEKADENTFAHIRIAEELLKELKPICK
jgi:tetratricopeptide repeat protein 21B